MADDRADDAAAATSSTSRSTEKWRALPSKASAAKRSLGSAWSQQHGFQYGGGAVSDASAISPIRDPLVERSPETLGFDLEPFVHVGRDVSERVRFHDVELQFEQARGIFVLVRPLEPDRHGDALPLRQILERHPVDLRSGLLEFTPRLEIGFL